jgi:hypothetical protein
MTLAQLDPSAKAPWTKIIFLTVDAVAGTCGWSAPTVRVESQQIENTNSARKAFIFEAACFTSFGKWADQPAANNFLGLLLLSAPPGSFELSLGVGSIWFLMFIFVSGFFVFSVAPAQAPLFHALPARCCARVCVMSLVMQ